MIGRSSTRLGGIASLITKGTTPTTVGFQYVDKGINFVKVESISSEGALISHKFAKVSEECHQAFKRSQIHEGDILFSIAGALGRSAIATKESLPANTNQAVAIVRLANPSASLPEYVLYALKSAAITEQIEANRAGSAQQNLSLKQLADFVIPLPPLEEQQRIVAVLDEAFAAIATAIANTGKNLANARALFGAIFAQALVEPGPGWSVVDLGDIADLISGQHIDASDYNNEQRGIGYLTGPSDFGERNPVVTKWTEHPKRTALRGDILITVKGSGVGSVNVMNEDELAISRQLMAVRLNATDLDLVYYSLEAGFEHFQALATGAAIPGISRADVLGFKIALPPQEELPNFMNRLHDLRANAVQMTDGYRAKIASLTALKQSLLHRAFTGELTAAMPDTIAA